MDVRTNTGGPAGTGPGRAAVDGVTPRPGRAAALRERWFACSSALGWGAAVEWPDPAVDAVCAVVTARHPGTAARDRAVERALARWAGARAGAGVGLAETLTDLAALHTAVSGGARADAPGRDDPTPSALDVSPAPGRGPDGVRLLRAVSLAWTDVACGDLAETAAVDPLSGLASARYLRTRLAEIYRAARAHGRAAGEEHALVVLALDVRDWRRVAPLTIAGEAAGVVFDAGRVDRRRRARHRRRPRPARGPRRAGGRAAPPAGTPARRRRGHGRDALGADRAPARHPRRRLRAAGAAAW